MGLIQTINVVRQGDGQLYFVRGEVSAAYLNAYHAADATVEVKKKDVKIATGRCYMPMPKGDLYCYIEGFESILGPLNQRDDQAIYANKFEEGDVIVFRYETDDGNEDVECPPDNEWQILYPWHQYHPSQIT